jgi:hypothetical protein
MAAEVRIKSFVLQSLQHVTTPIYEIHNQKFIASSWQYITWFTWCANDSSRKHASPQKSGGNSGSLGLILITL